MQVQKFTVSTSKTIQDFAKNITGTIAHAATLMSLNKLASQNLTKGQVLSVPVNLISADAKARMQAVKASSNKTKLALVGAALLGVGWYLKKKGSLKFS